MYAFIGVPEGEEGEMGQKVRDLMNENFPNLERDLDIQVHKACRFPQDFNPKRFFPRHIIIK